MSEVKLVYFCNLEFRYLREVIVGGRAMDLHSRAPRPALCCEPVAATYDEMGRVVRYWVLDHYLVRDGIRWPPLERRHPCIDPQSIALNEPTRPPVKRRIDRATRKALTKHDDQERAFWHLRGQAFGHHVPRKATFMEKFK